MHDPRLRGIPTVNRSPKITSPVRLSFGARSRLVNVIKTFHTEKEEENSVAGKESVKILSPLEYLKVHRYDEEIDFTGWFLGPVNASEISPELVLCSNIVRLLLANSRLGDEGGKVIAKGLEENLSVRELDLSGNTLGQNAISAIGEMISKNQTLEKLNLSRNDLTDKDVEVFLHSLSRKNVLKDLDLSNNILCDQFAKRMSFVLENNFVLEKLSVSSNQLEMTGLQAMLPGLRKNKTLRVLNISWNYLYDAGAEILGEVIAENRSLIEVLACGNLFTAQAATCLAKGVAENSKLKVLRIGQNLIRNLGAYEFVNVLSESSSPSIVLQMLDINGTIVDRRFKELIETGLPEKLSSLKVVNFSMVDSFVDTNS